MTWGMLPKVKIEKRFDQSYTDLINGFNDGLIDLGYSVDPTSDFTLEAKKKMKLSLLSVLTFERAYLYLFVRAEKSGKLVLEARYDFNSRTGMAINDLGRIKKEINSIFNGVEHLGLQ